MPLANRAFGPSRGQDDFRASAVHKATKHADLKLLTYLIIDNNAITQFLDRDGARPIVYAIRFDNPSAVKFLIGLRNEDGTRKVDLLQTVPKTAHQLMQEQPEAVNAALDAFFLGLSEEDGDDGCLGPARRALSPR